MLNHYFFTSVTRISDLEETPFEITRLPFSDWQAGDYVSTMTQDISGRLRNIELPNGRMAEIAEGEHLIGALGVRAATLEAVGSWASAGEDLSLDLMTPAGLIGKITSKSPFLRSPVSLDYIGHVTRAGKKIQMTDFVATTDTAATSGSNAFSLPIILIIGTSMSAGKTTSARTIVRLLKQAGYRVIGAKLTGAARYRDVLSLGDAGADIIYDFNDAGLASSICPAEQYRTALRQLLARMATEQADVLVAEAGASPLEPYNGLTAVEEVGNNVCFTLLCASDPYAVAGVSSAFECEPDLVAGGAANTSAGIELVEKLTGIKALNLLEKSSIPLLSKMIINKIENWQRPEV
ncbi:MAG: hypothetical protein DRR06_06160 [Gammaproteobacteria bacterium]|nr:MAG: hypothetical protein DRR06_06160 [Gammaproteobacteria bacterium]